MYDAIVVGAGVIGLCCAWSLRRRGRRVLVLDRNEPGAGASHGNAGWIVPAFSTPVPAPSVRATALGWLLRPNSPLALRPRLDPAFLGWLLAFWARCNPADYERGIAALARLNRDTLALFDALAADGVRFERHAQGVLFLFLSRAAAEAELADLRRIERHGFTPAEWLEGAALHAAEPNVGPRVAAGILAPAEQHVRPDTLVRGLAARLREQGVAIQAATPALAFNRRGERVTGVVTPGGVIPAERIVLAAGTATAALARQLHFALPLEGGKGYSLTYAPPPLAPPPRHALYLAEARVAITPFEGALRLAGMMDLGGRDETAPDARLRTLAAAPARYLDGWQPAGMPRGWAGLRPLTPDGLPVIGPLPTAENVLVATGHAMLGVTLAPATGEAIADLATGRPAPDLAPFAPGRFGGPGRGAEMG